MRLTLLSWAPVFLLPISNIIVCICSGSFPSADSSLLLTVGLAAVCEELFFRGLVLKCWLLPRLKPVCAVVLSAVIFGAAHILNWRGILSFDLVLPQIIFAVCFGVWAGAAVYRKDSILLPVLAHVLLNVTDQPIYLTWPWAVVAGITLIDGVVLLAED
ncbi:MAG: CPBP family intramembrane metalloprotease [bacterium]|nr:CPBP family intramembrane metalloprotease [bacterium]